MKEKKTMEQDCWRKISDDYIKKYRYSVNLKT